jgi:hypothetical protein
LNTYRFKEDPMADKPIIVAALTTAFLISSTILAAAQIGGTGTGGVGGGIGTGGIGGGIGTAPGGIGTAPGGIGTAPGGIGVAPGGVGTAPGGIGTVTPGTAAPGAIAPGTSTGSGASSSTLNSGAIGPGGIQMAPGSSVGTMPTQRVGPGGVPMAPGPAGDVSRNAFPTTTPGAASGSRPGCSATAGTDPLGVGTTPNIMVEPGQRAPTAAIPSQAPAAGTTVRPPGC